MNKRNTKKFKKRISRNYSCLFTYFMLRTHRLRSRKIKTQNKIMQMADMGMVMPHVQR